MNDLLDDFVAQPSNRQQLQQQQQQRPSQQPEPSGPSTSRSVFGHRRNASTPAQPSSAASTSYSNPFAHGDKDKDSAYGGDQDRASEMSRPSYQGSLGKAEKAGFLQKAKSKWKSGRSKSKDWAEGENKPVNTSPMGQQAQARAQNGTRPGPAGQANGHANGQSQNGAGGQPAQPSPQQVQQFLKDSMEAFFADVSEVKALLSKVQQQAQEVEAVHQHGKMCTTGAEAKASRQQVQDMISDVTRSVKKCKDKLTVLEDSNEDIVEAAEGAGLQDMTEIQMRLSIMTGLHVKLQDQCAAFGRMRAKWAAEDKAEVGRQLFTVTGQHFNDEELSAVVASGESHNIYKQALMAPGQSYQATLEMVSQIEQRNTEMAELERSLLDLHQIFLDMSVLVAGQSEMLDKIEGWVVNTQEQMRCALVDLQKAKVSRRAAQQKRAITFTAGLALVGVGAGISATGGGAVVGVPIALVGAAVAGVGAVM